MSSNNEPRHARHVVRLLIRSKGMCVSDVYLATRLLLRRAAPLDEGFLCWVIHAAVDFCSGDPFGWLEKSPDVADAIVDGVDENWTLYYQRVVNDWGKLAIPSAAAAPSTSAEALLHAAATTLRDRLGAAFGPTLRAALPRIERTPECGPTPLARLHYHGMLRLMELVPMEQPLERAQRYRLQKALQHAMEAQMAAFHQTGVFRHQGPSASLPGEEARAARQQVRMILQGGETQVAVARALRVAAPRLSQWLADEHAAADDVLVRDALSFAASHSYNLATASAEEDISFKYMPVSVFDVGRVGDSGIRGRQSTANSSRHTFSPFYADVAEWVVSYLLREKTMLFDPFAGWGERHHAARQARKGYIGYDTSRDALSYASRHWNVENVFADSACASIPSHDAVFTCPPYWNLESYAGEGLHRCPTWETFLAALRHVWLRVAAMAMPGAMYCIVVGDWRAKGVYYDLTFQMERILQDLRMRCFDRVILSYKKQAPLKAMVHQAKRLGYSMKVHQTLLVYVAD